MKSLFASLGKWLEHRTGVRKLTHEALYENIPGGSSWIYVTGSMLVFAFVTQLITGLFLWMCYSPSSQTAWESVYYIQNEMQGGWLLRGVHHFMAQAMIVLLLLHMLQVIICKAYRVPREFNYWTGLILMLLVLGMGLTGYLLPWDQKGYWATKVATNLMLLTPGGSYLQNLAVGGSDYGHHTLTRFFAVHAGLLPALMLLFMVLHLTLFRRHGITAEKSKKRADEYFWPRQVFKDAVACLVLLVVVLLAVIDWDVVGLATGKLQVTSLGGELGAPADPSEEYSAARPEWYFLSLFQLLKKFKSEFVGAILLPSAVLGFLFVIPFICRIKFGHIVNVVVISVLIISGVYLTYEARRDDNYALSRDAAPKDKIGMEKYNDSRKYLDSVHWAERDYERIKELIDAYGIPREGAVKLQYDDPETQGPRIFRRRCASCHSYEGNDTPIIRGPRPSKDGSPNGGPNLYGFASENWFRGILDPKKIVSQHYFGNTKHKDRKDGSGMVEWVKDNMSSENMSDDKKVEFHKKLDKMVAALSAEANLPGPAPRDAKAHADKLKEGRELIVDNFSCIECHKFGDEGTLGDAPDLTGYGSYDWLREFIANPEHARFYPDEDPNNKDENPIKKNDRMPAFAKHPSQPERNLLTEREMDMLVRWLRGDDKNLDEKIARLKAEKQKAKQAAP